MSDTPGRGQSAHLSPSGHVWMRDDDGVRYHASECWCWPVRTDPNDGRVIAPASTPSASEDSRPDQIPGSAPSREVPE